MFLPYGTETPDLVKLATEHRCAGLLADFDERQYHGLPFLSKSSLTEFAKSPKHFAYRRSNPMEPTPAMVLGTATHCAVFEPTRFLNTYAVLPEDMDRRTKEGKAAWADWQESNAGKTPLTAAMDVQIKGMIESLMSKEIGRSMLGADGAAVEAYNEISCFWRDPLHDIQWKARMDRLDLTRGIIYDLKTTDDARLESFERTVFNFKYHWQSPIYMDGLEYATGVKIRDFVFIAMERNPPHEFVVYRLKDDVITRGRNEYRAQLPTFEFCRNTGNFPGYTDEVQDVGLPRWADYR